MNNTAIQIPRKITQQLLHLAQISPEKEICGLLGAKNNIPTTCYPVDNIAQHPEKQFQMNPEQQIAAIKKMRENDEQLFAIYHSHPSAPAVPSATDLELANYPEALYLIISLNTKGVLEMRGYKIINHKPQEIILSMTP